MLSDIQTALLHFFNRCSPASGAEACSAADTDSVYSGSAPRQAIADHQALAISGIVFFLLGAAVGFKELADPDIGWHLAGGLWILDHRRLPGADPFSAEHHAWICYSWLPEILLAAIYRVGGFRSLQSVQALLIAGSFALSFFFTLAVLQQRGRGSARVFVHAVILAGILVLFIAPVMHLRPQLLSLWFFALLLLMGAKRRLSPIPVFLLTAVWANVHVYWCFSPLIVAAFSILPALRSKEKERLIAGIAAASAAAVAGLVSPYGWRNLSVVVSYLFSHQAANSLISEFQALSPADGIVFWQTVILLALVAGFARTVYRNAAPGEILLFLLFGALALRQIKFVPLFGLSAIPILAVIFSSMPPPANALRMHGFQKRNTALGAAAFVLFLLALAAAFELVTPLSEKRLELFAAVNAVKAQKSGNCIVLNHFDDGGWLAFAFYEPATKEPSCYTAVDGRTLVMGAKRLEEFTKIRNLTGNWCETISAWGANFAVLPAETKLTAVLESSPACPIRLRTLYSSAYWRVFELAGQR